MSRAYRPAAKTSMVRNRNIVKFCHLEFRDKVDLNFILTPLCEDRMAHLNSVNQCIEKPSYKWKT